ncbi:MAG: serpin family protein [candidate division Zixibacteria bacterium]|nr:serpin family protein [candidate division Zixibacteria bacterium]
MKQLGVFLGMHRMVSGSGIVGEAIFNRHSGADYVFDRASGGSHITLNDGHKEGSMYKYKNFLWVSLLSLCLLQCSQSTGPETDDPPPLRTPAQLTTAEKNLVESCNEFGFKLFREIVENTHPDSNIFISPLSVSYALAMLYNGADGETRQEIASVLELSGFTIDEVNLAYRNLAQILINADPDVDFTIANSLWYRTGVPVLASYKDIMREFFSSRVEELDFSASWAADTINSWVDENTNGKIDKILDPPIPENIVMLLLNAIYFKASWTFPFDEVETYTSTFYLETGGQEACQMMFKDTDSERKELGLQDIPLLFYQDGKIKAASLPYGKEGFRMVLLLPNPEIAFDSLAALFTRENWRNWNEGLSSVRFKLGMPKFKFEYETGLKRVLSILGINKAFDATTSADFSNLLSNGGVSVGSVRHKTFVQVDEKGTEAAAVTVIDFLTSEPPAIVANRPFLFFIEEERSGAIIFMGKLANPVWDE